VDSADIGCPNERIVFARGQSGLKEEAAFLEQTRRLASGSARQGEGRGDLEELPAHHHRRWDTEHLVEGTREVRRVGEVRGMRGIGHAGLPPMASIARVSLRHSM